MKPWLFDILACPIDKFFPLELYIFTFENTAEEFQSIIEIFENRDLNFIKNEELIKIYREKNNILIKDNIILEKSPLENYLKLIISSINELENIFDKSNNKLSENLFNTIKTEVKSKIIDFSKYMNSEQIDNILPELFILNKIKLELEIESGLLFCNKCKRWYPIIDTIPQMLPDAYRDKKIEIDFLKNNKDLLNKEFFNQELKPFSI